MIDIAFYQRFHEYKKSIMGGSKPGYIDAILNSMRSAFPVVFNIETTNACNQSCFFCPRTTKMTRPVKTMSPDVFKNIARQLYPQKGWDEWVDFAETNYGVPRDEQSENAFFLYILPKVITLHGYGDPLLDPHISDYVKELTLRNVPTYFSCNPSNIQMWRTQDVLYNGLDYIKYSIDSLSSGARGRDAFATDYPKIMEVLDLITKNNYKTQVIITMIDLGHKEEEFARLKDAFAGTGVYIYLKSLDQSWMLNTGRPPSIHWSEFCQIPWSSMTIKSDGLAASCEEDYNNEIILGDTKTTSLHDIWNSDAYNELRRKHLTNEPGIRCTDGRCDMKVIGKYL
jgi:MoaA/NifB/PqqE/SkfB family radical SAM enzyme